MKIMKKIRNKKNILAPADKTNNYYSITLNHAKLMRDSITTTYKISLEQTERNINYKAKIIAEKLELADKIDILDSKPAYITLKDHKENFRNHPKCRLINPSKSQIGLISKQILDKINRQILEATKLNQWINSNAVIEWFNNLETITQHS